MTHAIGVYMSNVQDDAYEITCLSRYFPESVCTGVYGVRYSLFYYLLLEIVYSCLASKPGSSVIIIKFTFEPYRSYAIRFKGQRNNRGGPGFEAIASCLLTCVNFVKAVA